MPRVSIIRGGSRRENTRRCLELIADDIMEAAPGRRIVIKPNFVSTSRQLASTHADHVRGILDFFKEMDGEEMTVAEAACGDTMEGFRNFGYLALQQDYGVRLVDLNQGPFEEVEVEDEMGRPVRARAASMLLDPENYVVSAAKLKTHDVVVATLSIKNMAMGCLCLSDRPKAHRGLRGLNLNIARLARRAWPDLAAIDGYEGMEGDGPSGGDPVALGISISSTDPLAADRVACEVMGVDFSRVGYLSMLASSGLGEADMKKMKIVGAPLSECIRPFRLHRGVEGQYGWK
jgi:uncharacterized protein (DUF362 family)